MLKGKNIVLGVCGGIAAYKVVELASRLTKAGAIVSVVMTKAATEFVTPLTFREITRQPVIVSMWDEPKRWNIEHIALAQRADLFVIAPATANVIAKMAHGIADDMLSTTILATEAPILVVPAMNDKMFLHPATQDNMKKLREFGYRILDPATGHMACGTFGPGRLPEPICIFEEVKSILQSKQDLVGQRFLITAGGTREAIDPVRGITNLSSGKMGFAIARAAQEAGAEVTLVSGPVSQPTPRGITRIDVTSALEMHAVVMAHVAAQNVFVGVAAVADYRPKATSTNKIKKNGNPASPIELILNPDILAEVAALPAPPLCIGFAAESQNLDEYAERKRAAKNIPLIVGNLIQDGFGGENNTLVLFDDEGHHPLTPASKLQLARQLVARIATLLEKR